MNDEDKRMQRLAQFFRDSFGGQPYRIFSSPGRAEIVGNHTDHNLGKVIVAAISCDILALAAPRDDGMIDIRAENFPSIRFSVHDLESREREKGKSIALVRGVLNYFARRGNRFGGFSAVTHSNVFRGAGVSSSAAFEVLIAEILDRLYLGRLTPLEKAYAARYAENVYFGKPCGLLDQVGVACGGFNLVDFGSDPPAVTPVPPLAGYRLVLTNTGGSHAALTNHYADIKRDMAEVSSFFGKHFLRELSAEELFSDLPALRKKVSDRAILRAAHFFEENERVDRAADALKKGDAPAFLQEVRESGESSLKWLQNCHVPASETQPVTLALKLSERILTDGAFRMMGGGFAGAVLAFCKEGTERSYGAQMARVFGRENVFYTGIRETGACEIMTSFEGKGE